MVSWWMPFSHVFLGSHAPKLCGWLVFWSAGTPNQSNKPSFKLSDGFNHTLNKQGMACIRGALWFIHPWLFWLSWLTWCNGHQWGSWILHFSFLHHNLHSKTVPHMLINGVILNHFGWTHSELQKFLQWRASFQSFGVSPLIPSHSELLNIVEAQSSTQFHCCCRLCCCPHIQFFSCDCALLWLCQAMVPGNCPSSAHTGSGSDAAHTLGFSNAILSSFTKQWLSCSLMMAASILFWDPSVFVAMLIFMSVWHWRLCKELGKTTFLSNTEVSKFCQSDSHSVSAPLSTNPKNIFHCWQNAVSTGTESEKLLLLQPMTNKSTKFCLCFCDIVISKHLNHLCFSAVNWFTEHFTFCVFVFSSVFVALLWQMIWNKFNGIQSQLQVVQTKQEIKNFMNHVLVTSQGTFSHCEVWLQNKSTLHDWFLMTLWTNPAGLMSQTETTPKHG